MSDTKPGHEKQRKIRMVTAKKMRVKARQKGTCINPQSPSFTACIFLYGIIPMQASSFRSASKASCCPLFACVNPARVCDFVAHSKW